MEIQRQSEYYNIDLPETRRASFTAEQIRDMTSGPSIPTGMLNTRTANPAALMRLLPLLGVGGDQSGGYLDQALGDVSGAESKAAFDRAEEEY